MFTFSAFFAVGSSAHTYLPNGALPDELTPAAKSLRSKGGIPRLETSLSELYMNRTQRSAMSSHSADQVEAYLVDDSVQVVFVLDDARFLETVKVSALSSGASVIAEFENRLELVVPVAELRTLSELEGVTYVRMPRPVFPINATPPAADFSTGSNVTQGVSRSNANAWHQRGITGRGVKVAILDSFKDYQTAQSLGELPPSITRFGTVDISSRHGTAVAEIIYDMAPDAALTIASPGSATQMAQQIVQLAQAGNRVISSSIGFYLDEPGDGSGTVSSAINTATNAHDAVYSQAAGNQALYHWDGYFTDNDGNDTHNFTSQADVNQLGYLQPGVPINLFLRWNNWPVSNQDYDLYLLFSTGGNWEVIAASENLQNGSQPPVEWITGTTSRAGFYGFAIVKYSATGNQVLDIMGHNMPGFQFNIPQRSLVDPATGTRSFSVAAVDVSSTLRESYSSQGPTHGPGGALTGGMTKPRISGFANVDTWSYGPGVFNGTSSATPHVAGAAALVRQAFPAYSALNVMQWLEQRAIDRGAAGYDYLYGLGLLFLGVPPEIVGAGFLPAVYLMLLLH